MLRTFFSGLSGAAWNVFEAPSSVVPNPVDLGVSLESPHSHRQVIQKELVNLFWRPWVGRRMCCEGKQ